MIHACVIEILFENNKIRLNFNSNWFKAEFSIHQAIFVKFLKENFEIFVLFFSNVFVHLFWIASCKNAFKPPNDCDYPYWDYVFNCAAETRLGKSDGIYLEGIYSLSMNCINEAISHNVRRYVEFSSGNMFSSEKWPIKEDHEKKPWTKVAQQKMRVEEELERRSDQLNYTILRLPLVYGVGDHKGLSMCVSFK